MLSWLIIILKALNLTDQLAYSKKHFNHIFEVNLAVGIALDSCIPCNFRQNPLFLSNLANDELTNISPETLSKSNGSLVSSFYIFISRLTLDIFPASTASFAPALAFLALVFVISSIADN